MRSGGSFCVRSHCYSRRSPSSRWKGLRLLKECSPPHSAMCTGETRREGGLCTLSRSAAAERTALGRRSSFPRAAIFSIRACRAIQAVRHFRVWLHQTTDGGHDGRTLHVAFKSRRRLQRGRGSEVPVCAECRRARRPAPFRGAHIQRRELSAVAGGYRARRLKIHGRIDAVIVIGTGRSFRVDDHDCLASVGFVHADQTPAWQRPAIQSSENPQFVLQPTGSGEGKDPLAPYPLPLIPYYASTFTTTRRFCARPSLVLLGATGFCSPKLMTLILCNGI